VRVIGESYGRDSVQQAWREFTLQDSGQFVVNNPHSELFFSWLFHRWSPALEKGHKLDDDTCYGIPPTRTYLARNAPHLDAFLQRYLEACLASRFGFYEILNCTPQVGFKARDIVAGVEHHVSEGMASTSLQDGDIVFAHIVPIDGTAMVEAVAPVSFPAACKKQLSELCRHRELCEHSDLPARQLYFAMFESRRCAPLPEIRNTDGEVIEIIYLYFDIECAQTAFDSLQSLALGATRGELLQRAKFGRDGALLEVSIPWNKRSAEGAAEIEALVLGYIRIRDRRLVVKVNSKQRARTIRALIANIPASTARYRRTRKQSIHARHRSQHNATDRGPRLHDKNGVAPGGRHLLVPAGRFPTST